MKWRRSNMTMPSAANRVVLSIATIIAAVLVAACVDGVVTGPRNLDQGPSLAVHTFVEDDDGAGNCRKDYVPGTISPGSGSDENGNGIICIRRVGGSNKKGPGK